jgi:hypothetical protein
MNLHQIHSLDSGGLRLSHHSSACIDDADAHAAARRTISAGGVAEVRQGSRDVGTVTMPHHRAHMKQKRSEDHVTNRITEFEEQDRKRRADAMAREMAAPLRVKPTPYPPRPQVQRRSDSERREGPVGGGADTGTAP